MITMAIRDIGRGELIGDEEVIDLTFTSEDDDDDDHGGQVVDTTLGSDDDSSSELMFRFTPLSADSAATSINTFSADLNDRNIESNVVDVKLFHKNIF